MSGVRVAALTILALAAAGACGSDSTSARPGDAIVEHIVDGDTIDVLVDGRTERVRLLGIDTPEIAHEAFGDRPANAAECYGDEATAFTTALIPIDTAIRLERDVVGRDDYGRLLAYVYRADDGLFVNHEIVRAGYAQPLTIEPNVTHHQLMVDAARQAEREGVGLWSACR